MDGLAESLQIQLMSRLALLRRGVITEVKVRMLHTSPGPVPDMWPVLVIERDGQCFDVTVSMDSEGNGPGHLFIEEVEDE